MKFPKNKITRLIAFIIMSAAAAVVLSACSAENEPAENSDGSLVSLEKDCLGKEIKFATPESFINDSLSGCYFISNINGDPQDKDDNGFIIKLDSDFKLLDNYFIDGRSDEIQLHAPKGMAVIDSTLYVTDIDMVRAFSVTSGRHLADHDFSVYEPRFLNDIAADTAGNIYISAMLTDRIFKIDTTAEIMLHANITGPNGLLFHPDGFLYTATWEEARIAKLLDEGTFENILALDEFENLDGLDIDKQGRFYFSDFRSGRIYRYEASGEKLDTLMEKLDNPADISIDRKNHLLLIPRFGSRCCVKKLD